MKHLKQFEEIELQWKEEHLQKIIDEISHYLEHAEELTGEEDLAPEDAIILLNEIGTEEALELSKNIDELLDLVAMYDVESEEEKVRLRLN
jgi:predicted RNA-binding protein with PUA domain